jgi:hypothetical protein
VQEIVEKLSDQLGQADAAVLSRRGLTEEAVAAAVKAVLSPEKMASEAPPTAGMTEDMTATIAYVADHQTAAMKNEPEAMPIVVRLLGLRPAYCGLFIANQQNGGNLRDVDWSEVCGPQREDTRVYNISTGLADEQFRAMRDDKHGILKDDEQRVMHAWDKRRTRDGRTSYSNYVGETGRGDGEERMQEHRYGNVQLCDRFRRKCETYGAKTKELEMWNQDDILGIARALAVNFNRVKNTAECLAFVITGAGTADGSTNVGPTGQVIGRTSKRLRVALHGLGATLQGAVPGLTFADATAIVMKRVPLSHLFDDAGIQHCAAAHGLDGRTAAGLLWLVLSAEGGKLPRSLSPSLHIYSIYI